MLTSNPIRLHGTLVNVHQVGILLQGKNGSGKSDTALALLTRGHQFIADDSVELYEKELKLHGRATELGKKSLFIHGLGLINCEKLFPPSQLPPFSCVDLVVCLQKNSPNNLEIDQITSEKIAGHTISKITLPAATSRPLADLIEAATHCFLLKKKGYNSAERFNKQLRNSMEID